MHILLTEKEYNELKERDTFDDSDLKLFEVKQKMETMYSKEPQWVIEAIYSKQRIGHFEFSTKIILSKETLEKMLEVLNSKI